MAHLFYMFTLLFTLQVVSSCFSFSSRPTLGTSSMCSFNQSVTTYNGSFNLVSILMLSLKWQTHQMVKKHRNGLMDGLSSTVSTYHVWVSNLDSSLCSDDGVVGSFKSATYQHEGLEEIFRSFSR